MFFSCCNPCCSTNTQTSGYLPNACNPCPTSSNCGCSNNTVLLQGPPGPQGPMGQIGPQGPQGPQGVQGPAGPSQAAAGVFLADTGSPVASNAVFPLNLVNMTPSNPITIENNTAILPVGTYLVNSMVNVSSPTAGTVSYNLLVNQKVYLDAPISMTITANGNACLSSSDILIVSSPNTVLSLQNSSAAQVNTASAKLTIIKLV